MYNYTIKWFLNYFRFYRIIFLKKRKKKQEILKE